MKLGIGSFTYRYSVGFGKFVPPGGKMSTADFIRSAKALGMDSIQLCENLKYADMPDDEQAACARLAKELGLEVEIGMNGLTEENFLRHIKLCKIYDSTMIRVVIGEIADSHEKMLQKAEETLHKVLPVCEKEGIVVGIENHFDLPTVYLKRLMEDIQSPYLGAIYDSTNGIGFIEHPEYTLDMLLPYLISAHIKDFVMLKGEASYMMTGRVLGEGQLEAEKLMRKIAKQDTVRSIVMETTIRRRDGATNEEAVAEELEQIARNAKVLRALVDKIY